MTDGRSELLNPPHHRIVKTNPAASHVLGKIVELTSRVIARGLEDNVLEYGVEWHRSRIVSELQSRSWSSHLSGSMTASLSHEKICSDGQSNGEVSVTRDKVLEPLVRKVKCGESTASIFTERHSGKEYGIQTSASNSFGSRPNIRDLIYSYSTVSGWGRRRKERICYDKDVQGHLYLPLSPTAGASAISTSQH